MGIFSKAKKWTKRKAKEAKRKAEEAARATEREARKAREAREAAERKAREARERLARDLRNLDKRLEQTTDPVERIAIRAEAAIRRGANEMDVQRMIRDEVRGLRDNIKRDVLGELDDKVVKTVTERVPELAEKGLREAREAAAKGAIKRALEELAVGVETFAPSTVEFDLGVALSFVAEVEVGCSIEIPNPAAKISRIRHWAAHPPSGLGQIMDVVRDFGPSSVSAGFAVCGNGPAFGWDGDDMYDRLEDFLRHHGVK